MKGKMLKIVSICIMGLLTMQTVFSSLGLADQMSVKAATIDESENEDVSNVSETYATLSQPGGDFYTDQLTVTIQLQGVNSGTYQLQTFGPKVTFYDGATITFGGSCPVGSSFDLIIKVEVDDIVYVDIYAFTKKVIVGCMPVYFTNNYNWDNVTLYYWGSTDSTMDWPGENMEYVETNSYGEKVYSAIIPCDVKGIVISNGSSVCQTVDITENLDCNIGFYISGQVNGKYTVKTYDYYQEQY